jgi:hypothetical protein
MNDYYSLEFLINTFTEHEIRAKENQKKIIDSFKENNPGAPLPDHMTDDFNLPKALLAICKEILALKDKDGIPEDK